MFIVVLLIIAKTKKLKCPTEEQINNYVKFVQQTTTQQQQG